MLRSLLIATQFLTRLPVPQSLTASEEELRKSAAFFPLVGVVVGGSGALLYVGLSPLLPATSCVLLVLVYFTVITNGFHEDGLADTFDGLGGGWTKERSLEIMRDSRIGTYGTLALIFLILGKYSFLLSLSPAQTWRWLIVAHTAGRWTTLPLCMWLPYARAEGQGKLVARQVGVREIIIGSITLLTALLLLSWHAALATLIVMAFVTLLSGLYFSARLQGITGDCLGATNQLTEVALYLTAVIMMGFDLL